MFLIYGKALNIDKWCKMQTMLVLGWLQNVYELWDGAGCKQQCPTLTMLALGQVMNVYGLRYGAGCSKTVSDADDGIIAMFYDNFEAR